MDDAVVHIEELQADWQSLYENVSTQLEEK